MDNLLQPPSPCPACSNSRTWSAGDADAWGRKPVRCLQCNRDARACPDCGWELAAARGGTNGVTGCVSCLLTREPAWGAVGRPARRRVLLGGSDLPPDEIARADRAEATIIATYRGRAAFAAGVREAVHRAQARARLEAALRSMRPNRGEAA
jgi:hypothetical protein